METQIQRFEHEQFGNIRAIDHDGEPWFVGNDVAAALGYARPRDAIRKFCKGGVKMTLPSASGQQETVVIPEPDLFRLIMHSNLPHAEAFQDWVFEEVLPTIRKHGGYQVGERREPRDIYEYAEALLEERDRRQLAEDRVEAFRPRTPYGEISRQTGLPRTRLTPAYFRSLKGEICRRLDEVQMRLFDF